MVAVAVVLIPLFAPMAHGPEQLPTDVNTFHEGNGGWGPRDADPAICYDTASAELLSNTMQGLLSWNGEQHYDFVPTLATNIPTRQNTTMVVTNTSTVGANPTGSTWTDGTSTSTCVGWVDEKQNGFDDGDIVYMTDGTRWNTWTADTVTNASTVTVSLWRGSYVFNVRTADSHGNPIQFYGSDGNAVDTFDVMDAAYSFRWAEVLDIPGVSPAWMFDKPFFDQLYHTYWTGATAMDLAHLINDAIVPDNVSNTLTLNVGCRFPDNAFKQILSNTWGAILSEEHSIALGGWDGNLFTTTKYGGPFPDWWIDWAGEGAGIDYVNLDPLNKVEAVTYAGTGPYHVALVDRANNKVILQKNPSFWQGWPAAGCNGSLDTIELDYIADWTTRKNEFLSGTIDTCAVPNVNMFELLDNTTKEPANPQTKTIKNLSPSPLSCSAFLFEFNISDESPYIGTGQFPDGIPSNFFNNTHVRRAFAYSFNWSTYGEQTFYGEYDYRKNWLIAGLYPDYYNDSIPGYYESLSNAEAELKAAVFNGTSVWDSGFNFTVGYGWVNDPRRIAFTMISDFFRRLSTYGGRNGPSFTVNVQAIPNVLADFGNRLRPICVIGWLADFADADDFARPHMWSDGIFGGFAPDQGYTAENGWGSTKDVLVDQAVLAADGSARATIYQKLQQIYYDDAPSFPLPTSRVRRWQQYWVKGWYYNPMDYGLTYFYPIWKSDDCWFDMSGPTPGVSDGVVNMRDIAYLVDHFNVKAPIAGQAIDPKWVGVYGANGCVDPSGDRVCNLRDIAGCILHFNHKMNTDTP